VEERTRQKIAGPTVQTLIAVGSFSAVWLILAIRGASDWSNGLGVVFYTLLIVAFVLSLTGGLSALVSRTITPGARWFCVGVGVAIPTVIILLAVAVIHALSQLN
jgi:hypothetical protein